MIYALGCRKDPVDLRDIPMGFVLPEIRVPGKVDYTRSMTPVRDQGDEGTCHSADTEILTRNGWKLFPAINYKDELATINPNTFNLEYEMSSQLHSYEFNGDLYCSSNVHLDFAVTPDHRMFVRKFDNIGCVLSSRYEFIKIKDLTWYSGLLSAPNKFDGKYVKKIKIGNKMVNGDDFFKFLGIFLSDGWVRRRKSSRYGYCVGVCCFKKEYYDSVCTLIRKLPFNFKEQPSRQGYFIVYDKELYNFLKIYSVNGSRNKFIPDFVKNAPTSQIQVFLDFFMLGDGHKTHDGRIWYYTRSKRMADDLQELVFKTGKNSSIRIRPARDKLIYNRRWIRAKNCGNGFVVSVWRTSQSSIDRKKQIYTKSYKGTVYCATVPNSLLVTRRNGKVLISGNCVAFASVVGVKEYEDTKEYKKTMSLSPRYVYSLCKQYDGIPGEEGTYPRIAMKMLLKHGVCPESYWPYKPYQTDKYKKGADTKAKIYRIKAYARLSSLSEMKRSLYVNGPFLAGVLVYESWFTKSVERTGMIPMPAKGEEALGGHAVCITGYDDGKGSFTFKNSWGKAWAKQGYGFLPYAYMQRFCSDAWSATDLIERPGSLVKIRQEILSRFVLTS